MLNLDKTKNKNILTNRIKIIILFSLIILIILTAIFIVFTKNKHNDNIKRSHHERHKNSIISKRESIVPPKNVKMTPGEVAPWNVKRTDGRKMAYLTFDDGPSINTTSILQILDKNKIKANFFIIGSNAERYPDLVMKEADDGEIIGNHTYSHQLNYKEGPENFVKDLNKCDGILKSILGNRYTSELVRFPGGSFDGKMHPGRLASFRDAATKAGYRYIDWNDETNDSESLDPSVPYLLDQLKKNTVGKNVVVVLMHDAGAKKNTVQALQQVIDYLKSQGFSFDTVE
ncbi:Peptidoglycan/xylan/chitin deacetylase, PgdA/CDA1 family [Clostridium acidisoli DSM 12555]|uniref:Peptidoglycan/xylan/chitin deacetylase, PgdA/CDA1 family n=1 Tax=Clostridium acidisoli DSM 12555 TaxID=1121291 RepID=A0A1W1XGD3_9CLOT|nr:polysaccharide deacetylase family protein [Clostridium acidisoli]SMC23009.1 Peptidoglycan/xylan/chitin deacetylase, PgdA/CDA1 family [Clostridium acidisoli DSM 12555]